MGNYYKGMAAPRGITVEQAAAQLQYSCSTVRRMIAAGELVAWKPRGSRGRKYLIDEISLARLQARFITSARAYAEPVQQRQFIQGTLF